MSLPHAGHPYSANQIRSRRLKPPCGFPVPLRIKSKTLAMAHEAPRRPAPATSPCAPSSSKCSLHMEDLLPAPTCPPGLSPLETPSLQSSPSRCLWPRPVPSSLLALTSLRRCLACAFLFPFVSLKFGWQERREFVSFPAVPSAPRIVLGTKYVPGKHLFTRFLAPGQGSARRETEAPKGRSHTGGRA